MDNQVDREKMLISGIRLNKGFTLLEIIIVLTIMSIASTSFYLLLRQPEEQQNLLDKINYFQELSLYTGSTYAFSRENIQMLQLLYVILEQRIFLTIQSKLTLLSLH